MRDRVLKLWGDINTFMTIIRVLWDVGLWGHSPPHFEHGLKKKKKKL